MKMLAKIIYRPKVYISLLIVFVCATVVVSVQASTKGAEMGNYQEKENTLTREVEDLENELVLLTSLSNKLAESDKLGLDEPVEMYYLKPQEAFASR